MKKSKRKRIEKEEKRAAREGSAAKNKPSVIRIIIFVAALAVFCYSAFMLISIFLEYKQGTDIYKDIQSQVLEEATTSVVLDDTEVEVPFVYDHNQLLAINSDGIGYLYIPSINVRLPMVQSEDNEFYLTHTFDKTTNSSGCLFEDYRITGGLSASNVIIYGHNMKNGSMFGLLSRYNSEDFYFTEGHDTFLIYTENVVRQYRIFSAYICDPLSDTYTFNFSSLSGLAAYAQKMKALSMYDTGVSVDDPSQIVTLSTCTSDGSRRFIIQGVFVAEAALEN
jgi:sortase B